MDALRLRLCQQGEVGPIYPDEYRDEVLNYAREHVITTERSLSTSPQAILLDRSPSVSSKVYFSRLSVVDGPVPTK